MGTTALGGYDEKTDAVVRPLRPSRIIAESARGRSLPSGARVLSVFVLRPLQQLAGLTRELTAERIERREPDRACFVGLEDREICERDAHAIRQLGERKVSIEKHVIEIDSNSHRAPQIVSE
jgi:hypothetical protein